MVGDVLQLRGLLNGSALHPFVTALRILLTAQAILPLTIVEIGIFLTSSPNARLR